MFPRPPPSLRSPTSSTEAAAGTGVLRLCKTKPHRRPRSATAPRRACVNTNHHCFNPKKHVRAKAGSTRPTGWREVCSLRQSRILRQSPPRSFRFAIARLLALTVDGLSPFLALPFFPLPPFSSSPPGAPFFSTGSIQILPALPKNRGRAAVVLRRGRCAASRRCQTQRR